MHQLKTELLNYGLSEKEAVVYLSALELGASSVQKISERAGVNRATTYLMIESLNERGLMSSGIKAKKRYFFAESPEHLKTFLRLKQKFWQEKENELQKIFPQLLALYNQEGVKPQIRYLEKMAGLQTARQIFAELKGDFMQIVPCDDLTNVQGFLENQDEYLKDLNQQKINYRALLVMKDPQIDKIPKVIGGEARLISADEFPIHSEITVRDDHVFLYSFKEEILSVIIISQEIADTVKALFNLAWRATETYPSKKQ